MINIARMLATLITGLIAGPAVSLHGSPTVSPVTDASCAGDPFPPRWPSSINFFALSHAAPPEVIEIARNKPVTMVPISRPPKTRGPRYAVATTKMTGNTPVQSSRGEQPWLQYPRTLRTQAAPSRSEFQVSSAIDVSLL